MRACVRVSVRTSQSIVNPISCRVFNTFTKTHINGALWDRDDRVKIWVQKVKGQGHAGIKYAGNHFLAW